MNTPEMRCATCPAACSYETSRPYSLGGIRGRVCLACEQSLGIALARWMVERGKELDRAEQRAEQLMRTQRRIEAQERALASEALPRARGRRVA